MKPHWYRITRTECPVCGCGKDYRTRMYDPKPDDPKDRIRFEQQYDNCLKV